VRVAISGAIETSGGNSHAVWHRSFQHPGIEDVLKQTSQLRASLVRRYLSLRFPQTFRLLFIMDLVAQGLITENFIEPSFERFDTWNG
jgi:hypothetical protein